MDLQNVERLQKNLKDGLAVEVQPVIDDIFRQHHQDFKPKRGYFSLQDEEVILFRSFELLQSELKGKNALTSHGVQKVWNQICAEFHQNKYWGFTPTLKKNPHKRPILKLTAIERELFPYIWAFFQAAILMKVVIYYFGIRATHEGSLQSNLFVAFAILFSFGSLFFFAWRQHRR